MGKPRLYSIKSCVHINQKIEMPSSTRSSVCVHWIFTHGEWWLPSSLVVHRFLIVAASLVVEHRP